MRLRIAIFADNSQSATTVGIATRRGCPMIVIRSLFRKSVFSDVGNAVPA